MIINLTEAFNVVHYIWDVIGVFLGVGFAIFIPCAVVVASLIKITESRKSKLENKDK